MNGLLSGDKVRPVLINSKLPLDVLGKVIKQTRANVSRETVDQSVLILTC